MSKMVDEADAVRATGMPIESCNQT